MIENITNLTSKVIEKIELYSTSDSVEAGNIGEKIDQLMPSVWIMIATFGALLITLIILTKLLYNPVKKMVQKRKEFIKQNIDESINAKKNAYELENEARIKLKESKLAKDEMISKAKIEAELIKNQYIEQAKQDAERILSEAKQDIELRKQNLEKEAYDEIVSVAIDISEKIIKDKISDKEAKKYLEEYLGNR